MINDFKKKIQGDLDIIVNNMDFLKMEVTKSDFDKVMDVLLDNNIWSLKCCSYEMDDIINGIIISIDEELKRLDNLKMDDINIRRDILNRLVDINNRLIYFPENKDYFLGKIKNIYKSIDGDCL
ncbi:MAG: hypothetical protein J6D28_03695 [Bacilli bacterium]|nr:hypothetical protein [Bacilli bacterium]